MVICFWKWILISLTPLPLNFKIISGAWGHLFVFSLFSSLLYLRLQKESDFNLILMWYMLL